MIDLLTIYPGVDVNRSGMLGICGGGGCTINAAKSEKRVKAVATLSMFNTGKVSTHIREVQERLKEANDARETMIKTGEEKPATGTLDLHTLTDEYIASIKNDLCRVLCYGKTHRHPNSTFEYMQASLMELMAFYKNRELNCAHILSPERTSS